MPSCSTKVQGIEHACLTNNVWDAPTLEGASWSHKGACEAQLESWIATAMGCAPKGTKRDCEPAEKLLDDWTSNPSQSQSGTYGEHGNTGGACP